MANVVDTSIHREFEGSDHCPIFIKIDLSGENGGNKDKCKDASQKSYGLSQEVSEFTYDFDGKYVPEELPPLEEGQQENLQDDGMSDEEE